MDLDKVLVNDNFVSSGKSKDIYLIPDGKHKGKYAFVFTDRGTGYRDKDGKPVFDPGYDDVVGEIPGKGAIACKFATYFFRLLAKQGIDPLHRHRGRQRHDRGARHADKHAGAGPGIPRFGTAFEPGVDLA